MSTHESTQHTPTPEEARAALAQAERNGVQDERDAHIHGLAVAGFGLAIGLFIGINELAQGTAWWPFVVIGYLVALVGLAAWQSNHSRSAPRHSKHLGYLGLAGTLVLSFAAIAVLNVAGHDERPALWLVAVCALVVAAPMLVTGSVIRGRASR